MREIKFRAWDESQRYMAYQGSPDLETIQSFMHHFGDKELMQFTGLKDKNGLKIYEGDTLNIGTVVFERGVFGVYPEYTDELVPVAEWSIVSREVVGNIYENKSL